MGTPYKYIDGPPCSAEACMHHPYSPCTMHHALCTMTLDYEPCSMHHAPFTMHHAPCTMHHARNDDFFFRRHPPQKKIFVHFSEGEGRGSSEVGKCPLFYFFSLWDLCLSDADILARNQSSSIVSDIFLQKGDGTKTTASVTSTSPS